MNLVLLINSVLLYFVYTSRPSIRLSVYNSKEIYLPLTFAAGPPTFSILRCVV